jgi:uncharacterized protein (DUF983 family)
MQPLICPKCNQEMKFVTFLRAPSPWHMKCKHCETKLKFTKLNTFYLLAFYLLILFTVYVIFKFVILKIFIPNAVFSELSFFFSIIPALFLAEYSTYLFVKLLGFKFTEK